MDTLHSVLFYAFAALAVAGGLVAALLGRRLRALGVGLVALGLAGLYVDLDAGFAAIVTLVAVGASALLLVGVRLPASASAPVAEEPAGIAQQVGAALAGVVLLVLIYAAVRGSYFAGATLHGQFNTAALGRLLVDRDALALEAVAAALLVAGVAGGLIARTRSR